MYVYVCFDVEDLVHPDSDDVALNIARMLADDGIVTNMCVVGEKARLWEQRGRDDVIAAVRRHDVSLHTNRHSMHPTPSEYLADKGWADGVAEAVRQEGPGVHDVARILGSSPSAWGTPGSSWGPQIPAATRQLGVPANIYSHARAGGTGACRFAGQLCYSEWVSLPRCEDDYCEAAAFEAALPGFLQQMSEAQRRGFSCLGLFAAHPTRLRYTAFWDDLNFAAGQNTDPAAYRSAPRRSDEEYATGLRNLRRMILALRDLPGIDLSPVRTLNGLFGSSEGSASRAELRQLAEAIVESGEISAENPLASPAQTLDILAQAVLTRADGGVLPERFPLRAVLGPTTEPPALKGPVTLPAELALRRLRELTQLIDSTGHLPASLPAGDIRVGPGPLLRAVAAVFLGLQRGAQPERVTLVPGAEEPSLAASLPERAIYRPLPHWLPHRRDLRLDLLALHTRLQTWSLRPAVLGDGAQG